MHCCSPRKTTRFVEQCRGLTIRLQYKNHHISEITAHTRGQSKRQPWCALQRTDPWPTTQWQKRQEALAGKHRLMKPYHRGWLSWLSYSNHQFCNFQTLFWVSKVKTEPDAFTRWYSLQSPPGHREDLSLLTLTVALCNPLQFLI